jgi:ribosomal protein L18
MEKVIRFKLDSGEIYDLPLEYVADNKARYMVSRNADNNYQQIFDETMADDYDAIDWVQNQMRYSDYQHRLRRVEEAEDIDYDCIFCNADVKIKEIK